MKRILIYSFILCFTVICFAQEIESTVFSSGTVEMNVLVDIGKMSTSYEGTRVYGSYNPSESFSYLNLAMAPGFFIYEGLSIETEIAILATENFEPGFSIIPNISYTYLLPQTNFAIFGRGGYGLSNSLSYSGFLYRNSDKLDNGILNLGAGIKFLVTQGAALRIEVNYKSTSFKNRYSFYGDELTQDMTLENIRLLFGFSVLL
jgi:hypothetical protein